jgi:hypothetical protein
MFVILGFYVDDSILVFNNIPFLNTTKMDLFQAFNMTNNGEFHYCLWIQVHKNRTNKTIHVNQEKYILEMLQQFGMENYKPSLMPMPTRMKSTFNMSSPFDISSWHEFDPLY